MHGNILDANSTNKLINQSVKEAVDNKIIEGGHVTKDLLEAETTRATEQENSLKTLIGAETSARTKGDEDLSSKIKTEQTRAEGKEKEISDKLAIVDGDSNNQEHTWTSEQVQNVYNILNLKIPDTSTIEDVTYTANMAYADFYPELLNEHQCIKYAAAVANDKDGYTGIQFCRWMADVAGKKERIDWDKFK